MRTILIFKSIINLIIGIVIIVLRESMLTYLSFVIAGALLLESIEDLIYIFIKKKFLENKDCLFSPLAITCIGILLIIENIISNTPESNIEFVCILWGSVSIFAGCKDIGISIYNYKEKKKFAFHFIEGIITLVFAFLLIINPLEHVLFHLVILGIEFILEAIVLLLHSIQYKKKEIHISDPKIQEEIVVIQEFLKEHPLKEEEIIEIIKHKE